MYSIFQEKISQIIDSYTKMTPKDNNKLIQDLISFLFQEKMDKINLGDSLAIIQKELDVHFDPSTKQNIMNDLKNNMSQVLTNAIMNRVKR